MPSRPNPGIQWAKFTFFYEGDSKEVSNDYWYSVAGGVIDASTDFNAAAVAFETAMLPPFIGLMCDSIKIKGVRAEFCDGAGTIGVERYLNVPGAVPGHPLPMDTAVVVQKQTAIFARPGHGRVFIAGIDEANTSGSYLTTAGVTAIGGLATAMLVVINSGPLSLAPAHFSPSSGLLHNIVNTAVVGLIATARRRRNRF